MQHQYVKDYRESPQDFDSMLIAIWNYFELVNENSAKLEDIWLNLLSVLQLQRPNKLTVFKAVHHQGFRNFVLKDPLIRQIINACEEYKDSGYAAMNPAKYLKKIYGIRQNCGLVEDPYEVHLHFNPQSETLKDIFEYIYHDKEAEIQAAIESQ